MKNKQKDLIKEEKNLQLMNLCKIISDKRHLIAKKYYKTKKMEIGKILNLKRQVILNRQQDIINFVESQINFYNFLIGLKKIIPLPPSKDCNKKIENYEKEIKNLQKRLSDAKMQKRNIKRTFKLRNY